MIQAHGLRQVLVGACLRGNSVATARSYYQLPIAVASIVGVGGVFC